MHDAVDTVSPGGTESADIIRFMNGFSVETTPATAAKIGDFRSILRSGAAVYVTFLPGSDYRDSIAAARQLREQGFEPVPHIAARSIASAAQFQDYLARVVGEAGVDRVLTIAGGLDNALGPYSDSMQLLESGLFDRFGIASIGVAGHPEGSPDISEESIRAALKWKNAFAERTDAELYIVTQFCFEAGPIIAWDRMLNAEGNRLPIRIGVPGIAKLTTLVKYAVACGIGNSVRFLKRRGAAVTGLLRQEAPDQLVRGLADYAAKDPGCGIDGVHMYPLGGLAKTALWSYAVVDGAFALKADGGFDVAVDLG